MAVQPQNGQQKILLAHSMEDSGSKHMQTANHYTPERKYPVPHG